MIQKAKKAGGWLAVCVAVIGASEGLRLYTYPDIVGVATYCYGETKDARWGATFTKDQCDDKLTARVLEFDQEVAKCVKHPLPDNRRVAYNSLAYNIGASAFCDSTLVKLENAGDANGACAQIPRWNRAGGVEHPGLTARRKREYEICRMG